MNAIAATLGLTPEYRASLFDKIIPSVQGGNYNVGMSSFTDSKKREEQVDFVTYFEAGSAWAQKVGAGINPEDACGKKIAVQTATVQDTEEMPARIQKCLEAGKPTINVVKFDDQTAATSAVMLGQADAMSADSPVTAYAIKQSGGKLEAAGRSSIPRPMGGLCRRVHRWPNPSSRHCSTSSTAVPTSRSPRTGAPRTGWSTSRSSTVQSAESPMTDGSPPAAIDAVPLRHPWRWVAAVVIVILLGLFVYGAATNEAYGWETYAKYLFDQRISEAAWNTLQLTIYSMALALVLGVLLAVMRLSPNPVLKAVSWAYLWIFRGTPIYVQLVLWGLVPVIYRNIQLGVPFGPTFFEFSLSDPNVFWLAVLGLGLNEAAYMAEIIRAGINSVPEGQAEASVALGMSWGMTMRRTVLPQAMRVIIPRRAMSSSAC